MRVNIYAEEMTDRVELITKEVEGNKFTAVRFYLELPATVNGQQYQGAFIHRPGDDDSSAVTFWGKRDLRPLLQKALAVLDQHYGETGAPAAGSAERRFQEGEFVHVKNERFHGFGIVKYHTDPEPQGRVGVTLENGNTWDYLAETVTPADKGSGMCYGTCALVGTDTDVAKEK